MMSIPGRLKESAVLPTAPRDIMADNLATFFRVEREMGLFDREDHGFCVWERIRVPAFRLIEANLGLYAHPAAAYRRWAGIKSQTRFAFDHLWRRSPRRAKASSLLIYGSSRRVHQPEGRWLDPFTDPVARCWPESSLTLERHFQGAHKRPPASSRLAYTDIMEAWAGRQARQRVRGGFVGLECERFWTTVEKAFSEAFGTHVYVRDLVRLCIAIHQPLQDAYSRVLERVRPRLVLLVASYGREEFVDVCRAKGIPVAEVQHGLVFPEHLGYGFDPRYASKETFPDYFLNWGRSWMDGVNLPRHSRSMTTGFAHIEQVAQRLGNRQGRNERTAQVVFLSQPNLGDTLADLALKVARQNPDTIEVVFRPHPKELSNWETRYPALRGSGIRVATEPNPDIHGLLHRADAAVGAGTTALFEAARLGALPILVPYHGWSAAKGIVASGSGIMAEDAQAVVEATTRSATREPTETWFATPRWDQIFEELVHGA